MRTPSIDDMCHPGIEVSSHQVADSLKNLVTPLRVAPPEVDEEVVQFCEEMLNRAKAGEILGIGVVTADPNRCESTAYCIGQGSVSSLITGCERLKLRLLQEGE